MPDLFELEGIHLAVEAAPTSARSQLLGVVVAVPSPESEHHGAVCRFERGKQRSMSLSRGCVQRLASDEDAVYCPPPARWSAVSFVEVGVRKHLCWGTV